MWRVLKIQNLARFDFICRECINTISDLYVWYVNTGIFWIEMLNTYIWYSLVISRKLHAEAQAVVQMTSKITIALCL